MNTEFENKLNNLDSYTERLTTVSNTMDTKIYEFMDSFSTVYKKVKEMADLSLAARELYDSVPQVRPVEDLYEEGSISSEDLEKYYDKHNILSYECVYAKETEYIMHDIIVNINRIVDRLNNVPEFCDHFEVI